MCLTAITERIKEGGKKSWGVGYKVFFRNFDKKPEGVVFSSSGGLILDPESAGVYPINKWVKANRSVKCFATSDSPIKSACGSYVSGFHIFTSLKGAIKWRGQDKNEEIRQVYYRKAHTTGIQCQHRCIVAEEIKLGKVVKPVRNSR